MDASVPDVELREQDTLSVKSSSCTLPHVPSSTQIDIEYDAKKIGGAAVIGKTHLQQFISIISALSVASIASNIVSWVLIAILAALAMNEYFAWCYIVERAMNIMILMIIGACGFNIRFQMQINPYSQLVLFLLTFMFSSYSLVEFYMELNSVKLDPFFKNGEVSSAASNDSFPLVIVLLVTSSVWEFLYFYKFCYVYVNRHVRYADTCISYGIGNATAPSSTLHEDWSIHELDTLSSAELVATPSSSARSTSAATADSSSTLYPQSVWSFGHFFTSPSPVKAKQVFPFDEVLPISKMSTSAAVAAAELETPRV
jgi:hypothetical protein